MRAQKQEINKLVNNYNDILNNWDNNLDKFNKALAQASKDWSPLESRDLSNMDKDQAAKFLEDILDVYNPLIDAYTSLIFNVIASIL